MSDPDSSRRQLGLFSATAAVIATMIGAGIFGATGGFAHQLGTDANVLLVWLFCGLLALTGALSLGELGAMMPRSGGCYAYNRHLYGDTAGYLSGVLSWLLAFVGALAYITLLLGHHVQQFAPDLPPAAAASIVVVLLTAAHCFGLREGNWMNNAFTIFKVGVILAFIVAGFSVPAQAELNTTIDTSGILTAPFASAMISVSFAYLGWETATWIAGDLRDPQKNLPRSLIVGTAFVTGLYLLLNIVFLRAQSVTTMEEKIDGIGLHAAELLFSGNVSTWFNYMIIAVLLSTTSTILMVGARILAAMAQDGQLPAVLAKTNAREAPIPSLVVQAIFTIIFVWAASSHGNADNVLVLIGMPTTVIMGAAIAGVLILRHREPDTERPFRVPLYPLPPLLFLALSIWMLISTFQYKWQASLGSLALVLIAWLLKPLLTRGAKPHSTAKKH
jgi:APA family basic amino acid/polyamine antiporter